MTKSYIKLTCILFIVHFSLFIVFAQTSPNKKIKIYFNQPVNTSVSNGNNAIYVKDALADTIIAYVNKAKISLDIAMYDYMQVFSGDPTIADIYTAVNNAYSKGVIVRWIYNGSSDNSGIKLLNSNIHKLASPTTSSYGIMHNKFMIIDAKSSDTTAPILWTGSMNWDPEQIDWDVNNVVIIQDQKLAQAYTAEFNQMWGDIGSVPNTTNSKFGPYKTPTTAHTFTIDGSIVNLYFSPSDGTNTQIINTINSANTDFYFGIYDFTMDANAEAILARQKAGVIVAGILDQDSKPNYAYTGYLETLGSAVKIYTESNSLYHNKFCIVDPSDTASDPQILTGSHNWTNDANTKNDENTLIIHSASIANVYYQSFYQNFTDLGGTMPVITGIKENSQFSILNSQFNIYPNPAPEGATVSLYINYSLLTKSSASIFIYNILGSKIKEIDNISSINTSISLNAIDKGLYFYQVCSENKILKTGKLIIN